MTKYFTTLIVAVFCTLVFGQNPLNYKVYMSISNGIVPELLDTTTWKTVSEGLDGPWMLTHDLRHYPEIWTSAKKLQLGASFKNKATYAEIPINEQHDFSKFPQHLREIEDCGFVSHGIMWYREPEAMLAPAQLDTILKYYGKGYGETLLLARIWRAEQYPAMMQKVDGLVFEFALPYEYDWVESSICEGVKWCIDNNKKVFLLMPPSPKEAYLDNRFIKGIQTFYAALKREIGPDRLNSPNLAFVPAAYNWYKKKIHLTPERNADGTYANTATGAALFLLEQRGR